MRLGIFITCLFALAQGREAPPPLKFEVASVKPSPPDSRGGGWGCHGTDKTPGIVTVPLGRCVFRHIDVRNLVAQAYPILPSAFRMVEGINAQVPGGPNWIGGSFFDIEGEATNPATATDAQLRQMVQTLLKDRFQLAFHMESKETSAYVIVPAKEGIKLKESTGPMTPEQASQRPRNALFAPNMTVSDFADLLSIYLKIALIDKSGLTAKYVFTLNSLETGDGNAPSIFTAMPEQLGLRLESQKVSFPIFVIDHLEKPEEN